MELIARPDLPGMAATYHAYGANVLAIQRDAKKPAHAWKRWQTTRQLATELRTLPWGKAGRIGLINGVGAVRSLDLDGTPEGIDGGHIVWRVLAAMGLPEAYPWVEQSASGRGWHIWFVCDEALPSGVLTSKPDETGVYWGTSIDGSFDHVELRWEHNQTIIASSDGTDRWLNDAPTAPFARVSADQVLAGFRAIAQTAHTVQRDAPALPAPASSDSHTKDDIRGRFDMVAFARHAFGGEVERDPDGQWRVRGHGGMLINTEKRLWYRFGGEVGGDAFDLIGLARYGEAWNRHDKTMFAAVLHEASTETGIPLEATRVQRLRVVGSAEETSAVDEGEADDAWSRFLPKRLGVWNAIQNGVEPPQFLITPLVLEGKVTVIFGGPEQGKTWVLLYAVMETLRQGKKVLLIDEESGLRDTAERLQALGLTEEDDALLYYFAFSLEGTLEEMANAILTGVVREGFALIGCDSISKLFAANGLDENSNSDATRLMRAWITPASHVYGCAFLGLDHTTKVDDDSRYGRGAGSKLADVDVQFHIQAKVPPSRTSRGRLVLDCTKDRTATVPKSIRYLAGGDGAGGVRVECEGTSDVPAPSIRTKDKSAVEVLFGGLNSGKRASDWLDMTGLARRTFFDMLDRLTKQNVIAKSGDLYYVTQRGADVCGLSAGAESALDQTALRSAGSDPPPLRGGQTRTSTGDGAAQSDSHLDQEEGWPDGKAPF